MFEEDILHRNKQSISKDNPRMDISNEELRRSDSIHFAYLYDYISENVWPSLIDSSRFACLLAIHDHVCHSLYIPYLKKAIMNEVEDMSVLKLILYSPRYFKTNKSGALSIK